MTYTQISCAFKHQIYPSTSALCSLFRLQSLRANQALSIHSISVYLFSTSNLLAKFAIQYSYIFEHGALSTS